jgi:hypothetical protein
LPGPCRTFFFLGLRWIRHYREHFEGWTLPCGVMVFLLTIVSDILVTLQVYHFFYILDLGFAVLTLMMAYQLFQFYVHTSAQLERRTQEVALLNDEMGFLVSSMSHDLKAPLISIRGFSELLGRNDVQEAGKRRDFLIRIEDNARQMLEWLDDIIEYVKIGSILGERALVIFASRGEVEGMLVRPPRGASHPYRLATGLAAAVSSSKGIKKILLNLLQNAVKFSSEDSEVQVECFYENDAVHFWVSDQGSGVPQELREKTSIPTSAITATSPVPGWDWRSCERPPNVWEGKAWVDSAYQGGARFCVSVPDEENELRGLNGSLSARARQHGALGWKTKALSRGLFPEVLLPAERRAFGCATPCWRRAATGFGLGRSLGDRLRRQQAKRPRRGQRDGHGRAGAHRPRYLFFPSRRKRRLQQRAARQIAVRRT